MLLTQGCGLLSTTPCNDIADVVHDASLFLCQVAQGDTTNKSIVELTRIETLNTYIHAISKLPATPQQQEILARLVTAKRITETVGVR